MLVQKKVQIWEVFVFQDLSFPYRAANKNKKSARTKQNHCNIISLTTQSSSLCRLVNLITKLYPTVSLTYLLSIWKPHPLCNPKGETNPLYINFKLQANITQWMLLCPQMCQESLYMSLFCYWAHSPLGPLPVLRWPTRQPSVLCAGDTVPSLNRKWPLKTWPRPVLDLFTQQILIRAS